MIRKILKVLAWIVGSTVGLVVVLYLVALAINWKDRDPSPTALRFASLYKNRQVIADVDNGFVFAMGADAGPEDDPQILGSKRVAWLSESAKSGVLNLELDPARNAKPHSGVRDPAAKDFFEKCRANDACKDSYEVSDDALNKIIFSESWVLERYLSLLQKGGWVEVVPLDAAAPLPSYKVATDGQKLLLARAMVLARKGDTLAVRELLTADIQFWRRVLASSDILISKMVATAAINRHFQIGSLVIRHIKPSESLSALPSEWLVPIQDSERSMQRCLAGELIFSTGVAAEMLRDRKFSYDEDKSIVDEVSARLAMPLFKIQDTANDNAEFFDALLSTLDVPFDRLSDAFVKADKLAVERAKNALPLKSVYNLVGRGLMGVSSTSYASYAVRVADIEGTRRAAELAVQLRRSGVKTEDAPSAIQGSQIRNPYTNQSFSWDENRKAIVFTGLEPGERGRHLIYY